MPVYARADLGRPLTTAAWSGTTQPVQQISLHLQAMTTLTTPCLATTWGVPAHPSRMSSRFWKVAASGNKQQDNIQWLTSLMRQVPSTVVPEGRAGCNSPCHCVSDAPQVAAGLCTHCCRIISEFSIFLQCAIRRAMAALMHRREAASCAPDCITMLLTSLQICHHCRVGHRWARPAEALRSDRMCRHGRSAWQPHDCL